MGFLDSFKKCFPRSFGSSSTSSISPNDCLSERISKQQEIDSKEWRLVSEIRFGNYVPPESESETTNCIFSKWKSRKPNFADITVGLRQERRRRRESVEEWLDKIDKIPPNEIEPPMDFGRRMRAEAQCTCRLCKNPNPHVVFTKRNPFASAP